MFSLLGMTNEHGRPDKKGVFSVNNSTVVGFPESFLPMSCGDLVKCG